LRDVLDNCASVHHDDAREAKGLGIGVGDGGGQERGMESVGGSPSCRLIVSKMELAAP